LQFEAGRLKNYPTRDFDSISLGVSTSFLPSLTSRFPPHLLGLPLPHLYEPCPSCSRQCYPDPFQEQYSLTEESMSWLKAQFISLKIYKLNLKVLPLLLSYLSLVPLLTMLPPLQVVSILWLPHAFLSTQGQGSNCWHLGHLIQVNIHIVLNIKSIICEIKMLGLG
jgi:hypothetical protein